MMHKIKWKDLGPVEAQMQMTNFVRHFTPRSWWPHLMPHMVQVWAMLLQRAAFGEVSEDIFERLHLHGKGHGGVGTWWKDAEGVYYTWSGGGICSTFKLPEWGPGVWREVSFGLQVSVTPFTDWSDEFKREDWADLQSELIHAGRGKRVFEALGILGGIWAPEGDM